MAELMHLKGREGKWFQDKPNQMGEGGG